MTSGPRIVLAGGPRTGKTTLGRELAAKHRIPLRSTDDLIGRLDWSDASAEVARWLDEPGPHVIEGVAVVRAVRKWLETHGRHEALPWTAFHWLDVPKVPRTPGQETMAKGCRTVWLGIRDELFARGLRLP